MMKQAGIQTAPHSLIRMADGELAYITRRMDRKPDGGKLSMLDMCQLTNLSFLMRIMMYGEN